MSYSVLIIGYGSIGKRHASLLTKMDNISNVSILSSQSSLPYDTISSLEEISKINPDYVIISAAKVGGIYANQTYKANFFYQNLMIQTNLIHASYLAGVKKLIFLGSSCIYPKFSKQPIKEEYLLSGLLEPSNDTYAVAKIAGLKMCDAYNKQYNLNYLCLMPANLYGPNDNYDPAYSHFYPALLSKIYKAKINNKKNIVLWGNGKAKRELMYVDDVAHACEYFLKKKANVEIIDTQITDFLIIE